MSARINPVVSVILPVSNAVQSISRAVDSIRNQTLTDWELIIVDDASTDGTSQVLGDLAKQDERIVVFRLDKNQGTAHALNFAWKKAQGNLVARMDADDFSLPDRLALQVAFFSKHSDIEVLGTGVLLENSNGETVGESTKPETHEQLMKEMSIRVPFFHPTVMFRKDFLQRCGGYEPMWRRHQDLELWWRTYRNSNFANLTQPLLRYKLPPAKKTSLSMTYLRCNVWVRWHDGKMIQAICWPIFSLVYWVLTWSHIWKPRYLRSRKKDN